MKNQSSHQNRQPIKHGTTPPRIFIAIQYLEIGGAERSLIGLLNALDYSRCQVDLFVYRHSGEFMNLIPKEVNLLPEVYSGGGFAQSPFCRLYRLPVDIVLFVF